MKSADGNQPRHACETVMKIAMIVGALLWTSAVFLRGSRAMQYSILNVVLGVAPNFGAVWMSFGLVHTVVFPFLLKRKLDWMHTGPLLWLILALLLASEVIHDIFLNAPFDVWDMVASGIAAVILWLVIKLAK